MNRHFVVLFTVLFMFMLTACSQSKAAESTATPSLVPSLEPTSTDILKGFVEEREGIHTVVMRLCNCHIESYSRVGVILEQDGRQKLHIDGHWALSYLELIQQYAKTKVGNRVLVGPQKMIAEMAQPGVMTFSGGYIPDSDQYSFMVQGGDFKKPMGIEGINGKWESIVEGKRYSIADGIQIATALK